MSGSGVGSSNGWWGTAGRILVGALAGWLISTLTNFWIFTERERVLLLRIEANTKAIESIQTDVREINRSLQTIARREPGP